MTAFETLLESFNEAARALYAERTDPDPLVQTPRYRLMVADYEDALLALDLAVGRRAPSPPALPSPRKQAEKE